MRAYRRRRGAMQGAEEEVGVLSERLLISLTLVERKVLAVELTLACVLQSYQRES